MQCHKYLVKMPEETASLSLLLAKEGGILFEEELNKLGQKFSIPENALNYAKRIGKFVRFQNKEHLVHQGQGSSTVYIVLTGLLRSYNVSEEKEWTSTFFKKGEIAGDFQGIIFGTQAERYLMALEETTCFCFPFKKMREEFSEEPWLEKSLSQYMKNEYSKRAKLKMYLLSCKPEERYKYLEESMPWIFDRVSDKYIACFMGITPVSLSRIKKRFRKS